MKLLNHYSSPSLK